MGKPEKPDLGVDTVYVEYLRHMIRDLYDLADPLIRLLTGGISISLSRSRDVDLLVVGRRTASEGMPFLTQRLPLLDKALLRFYELGSYEPPPGFRTCEQSHSFDRWLGKQELCLVPSFLGPITSLLLAAHCVVSDRYSSVWRERDSVIAALGRLVRVYRSVSLAFYKLDLPFPPALVQEKFDGFVAIEEELARQEFPSDNRVLETAEHVASHVLKGFLPLRYCGLPVDDAEESALVSGGGSSWYSIRIPRRWVPRHGPGAVATGEKRDDKWVFSHRYISLDSELPYVDYMYGITENGRRVHLAARVKEYRALKLCPYPVAKLVAVPKDSRGPRLISEEPLELQYMQQMLSVPLVEFLEKDSAVCGQINFTSQVINRELALANSLPSDGAVFATIDLKDASDRVTWRLVRRIMPRRLFRLFMALRSYETNLPDGRSVWLEKYAPMGSALCFPVESVIFYCLAVAVLIERGGYTFSEATSAVYVYGDDLIVPNHCVEQLAEDFLSVGLVVNLEKSFAHGFFRESCGMDAYFGTQVTPLRLKKPWSPDRRTGTNLCAWVSYADSLWEFTCPSTRMYVEALIHKALGPLPWTERPVGYLSYVRPGYAWPHQRYAEVARVVWCSDLQVLRSSLWVVKPSTMESTASEWEHLAKALQMPSRESDPARQTVRGAVVIRRRKMTIA